MEKTIISLSIIGILMLNLASALTINSISTDAISPGQTSEINIELKNTLDDDVKDVSFLLNLANLPFTSVGSSEESVEKIDEGDEEDFTFSVKAANDIKPGDYQIPYILFYEIRNEQKQRSGSIGITVKADSELSFSVSQDKPIENQEDKIVFKIINKGFGDAKFMTVKLIPEGFTLLSENEVYIGSIDSDDFETLSFNVIYKTDKPTFSAIIEYKDFDNKRLIKTVNIPLTIYSKEKAIELGIIKKDNTPLYIGILILLIVIWFLYRTIKKSIKRNRLNNKR